MANAYSKAVWLGIVAGMRSMSAPAIVSRHYSSVRSAELDASALSFIASPAHAAVSNILASGERVADKFPFIPDRIDTGSLGFRPLSGGFCGAVICTAERENRAAGAIAGALGAVVSAYAMYYLRKTIAERTGAPDALLGLAEDALAAGIGSAALDDA